MFFKILFSKLKYYKKRLSLMDTRLLIIAGPLLIAASWNQYWSFSYSASVYHVNLHSVN
jgi:hypothetical protein